MKKLERLLVFMFVGITFLLCSPVVVAMEISQKFGKATKDELEMTVYDKDSSAAAVVLYESGKTTFEYSSLVGFQVVTEVVRRIKVLKQEGTEEGNRALAYYYKSPSERDVLSGLTANVYNLVQGAIQKTALDKAYQFDEKLNDKYHQLKFSLPSVSVGSVLEFKYRLTSMIYFDIPDWEMQDDIPVITSDYTVSIPEYFVYNLAVKGYQTIEVKETQENETLNLGTQGGTGGGATETLNCKNRIIVFKGRDLPALKQEPFVWYVNDFTTGVRFELSGTNFPNTVYKAYTQTWDDLEKTLLANDDIAINLKLANPYKQEMPVILKDANTADQKIEAIYRFLKQSIKWNDEYALVGINPKEAFNKGVGNNAQFNYILLSMLRDAGITCFPLLISRRNLGRLPMTYPSIDQLNTFIVGARNQAGNVVVMDGSALYGGVNMLPTNLMVDRARIFLDTEPEKWMDLTKITKNTRVHLVTATLDEKGIMKGTVQSAFTNALAYMKKEALAHSDSLTVVENMQRDYQLVVDSLTRKGLETMSNRVDERFVFTKTVEPTGDFIYINPLVVLHTKNNPFQQSNRVMPVEFDYPYTFHYTLRLTIPDGYQVEEMPTSQRLMLDEGKGQCLYTVQNQNNLIQMVYLYDLSTCIFPTSAYQAIKDFFAKLALKNAEMIVLKKKTT